MKVEKDYEELVRSFNKHKVRYCIIGAFAVAFHAKPRYTKDMDILVGADIENGKKIIAALEEFGFGSLSLSAEDFAKSGKTIQLGYEPVRVDILTSIEGLDFEEAWKNKKAGAYGNEKAFFVGLSQLIKSKKLAARKRDIEDIDILLEAKKRKNKTK